MKCPCEDCITLAMCRNLNQNRSVNIIDAIEKCSILYDFLKIRKVSRPTTEIWSNWERTELDDALDMVKKNLRYSRG